MQIAPRQSTYSKPEDIHVLLQPLAVSLLELVHVPPGPHEAAVDEARQGGGGPDGEVGWEGDYPRVSVPSMS